MTKTDWLPSRALYERMERSGTKDMGLMDTVRNRPWTCRVVLHRKKAKGRKDPVEDLMVDAIGALLAGLFATWVLKWEPHQNR